MKDAQPLTRGPRLLDLFCGAGGAAAGYVRAGFRVTGIDIKPQGGYPFEFIKGDAMSFGPGWIAERFDAIHASPPCQAYSTLGSSYDRTKHPDLVGRTRELLQRSGLPYVIENVPGAPLVNPLRICGTGLGLKVQRHRMFEVTFPAWGVPCAHGQNAWNSAYKHATGRKRRRVPVIGEWRVPKALQFEAMGIGWMTLEELTEAIPPAFTEHLGQFLLAAVLEAA